MAARDTPFGRWMRDRRLELRMTASESAERCGMKLSTWSGWETGRSRRKDGAPAQPRRETVRAIACALNSRLNEAYAAAGYAEALAEPDAAFDQDLAWILAKVPEDKRPAARRAVRSFAESLLLLAS